MERWLYDTLLSLSFGNSVQFEEVRGYMYWSALVVWLKEHNIRYKCEFIGRMYVFVIDGRCVKRLGKLCKYS